MNAAAGADKKSRWRKDKKEEVEKPALVAQNNQKSKVENRAAALAFRGLHGAKSDFSLFSGAMDDAYKTVLGGNAYSYQGLICTPDDFSMHEALVKELDYVPCWMSGGMPLHRPTALGREEAMKRSPTYERIVRWLAGYFGVEPIRSLVNYYRDGGDHTSFHSDQYFSGVNMTIGASFGDARDLVFEHRESKQRFTFPQRNGDIFAFTNEVNDQFTHAVPREPRRAHSASRGHTPGRVSVILWAKKDQEEWRRLAETKPLNLQPLPHVLEYDPNAPASTEGVSLQEEEVEQETDESVPVSSEEAATADNSSMQADAAEQPQAPESSKAGEAVEKPKSSWRRARR